MTVNVAVFASGSGSNLQSFIDVERDDPSWPGKLALVVSDQPTCRAVERARDAGIATFAVRPKEFADKAAYETAVVAALKEAEVAWVLLAGYMRLIGPVLLEAYSNRILNVHPSLLPAFPGKQAIRDALDAGADWTGVTIHYVDEGVDTGPIVAQEAVEIRVDDTEESLLERVHAVEHRLYPTVVRGLLS